MYVFLIFFRQSFWVPYYDVMDHTGKQIFKIKGPCCVCPGPCCTCDFPFDIYTMGDSEDPIGKISKEYGGLVKEMFTNATNFSVTCKFFFCKKLLLTFQVPKWIKRLSSELDLGLIKNRVKPMTLHLTFEAYCLTFSVKVSLSRTSRYVRSCRWRRHVMMLPRFSASVENRWPATRTKAR